jgi:hypothetical protein
MAMFGTSKFYLYRYQSYPITSKLDPFSDVLNMLDSLTSTEYVVELQSRTHGIPPDEAKQRAKRICPNVRAALQYVQQSLVGPPEVSFLPAYYAILCLSKVYVLLGKKHADLPTKQHGVTYLGHDKDSQTLLTEEIKLQPKGEIPLLYETITGQEIKKAVTLTMKEVYPFLGDVGAEHQLAAGVPSSLAMLDWTLSRTAQGNVGSSVTVKPFDNSRALSRQELKALRGFKADPQNPGHFIGPTVAGNVDVSTELRKHVRAELIYSLEDFDAIPLSAKHLLLPEELPIALAFFHMSSVVRYKPEFFERLRDSRFWPVVSATRRHCLLKSLILCWSFVHRRSLLIRHE